MHLCVSLLCRRPSSGATVSGADLELGRELETEHAAYIELSQLRSYSKYFTVER
jgi:hypothetical protein